MEERILPANLREYALMQECKAKSILNLFLLALIRAKILFFY